MPGGVIQVTVDRVDRFKRQVDFRLYDDRQVQKQLFYTVYRRIVVRKLLKM
jgi:hypothetical protein